MYSKNSLETIQIPTMESSTARWSIPGKSISFNEGAEEKKQEKHCEDFTKQHNKIERQTNKADLVQQLCGGSPMLEHQYVERCTGK